MTDKIDRAKLISAIIDQAFYDALWKFKKNHWYRDNAAFNWINGEMCQIYAEDSKTNYTFIRNVVNKNPIEQQKFRKEIINYFKV